MHYTYILYSKSIDKFYVGSTNNIDNRIYRHNKGQSKYTRKGIPWELVYLEKFNNRTDAYRREKQIKNMKSRKYILELIAKG